MKPIIDPRKGDFEDDASSTKRRSLISLAGSLLVEISLPKLALAWLFMLVLPSLLLGVTPIAVSVWVSTVKEKAYYSLTDFWPALLLLGVIAFGWFGGRALFRLAESSFWSLNSLAVEPVYMICREGLRFCVEMLLPSRTTTAQYATLRRRSGRRRLGDMWCGLSGVGIRLAELALAGHDWRSNFPTPSCSCRLGQQRRAGRCLFCGRLACLGNCRCLDGPTPNRRQISITSLPRSHLEDRAFVGYSCGRRAIRFSDRVWAIRPARQRTH